MRRQTATGGAQPAGSSRKLRLDPLSLPVRFNADDDRADGGVRQIELHRERVVLHRAVAGMQMAVNVRVSDFAGVERRRLAEGEMVLLVHRDPSLSVPLCISSDADEIETAWQNWSELFALPQLQRDANREPTPRRRRRNAVKTRRPRFLLRRRIGALLNPASIFRGEREIIARN